MALTNQQVQAAYLAIIGRPAEGSAVTWAIDSFADLASLVSSIIDIRKGGDFSNNKETFVENLYQNLLGRPSDAEGKEFWLKALNDGASYAQVAQGFINAVLGQSQTEDLYKLQNKLDVAEKISAQINTFQGGAAAEATLKELMSTVNANTTFANVEDSVKEFKGQNVDIANVTVKQGADKPAEGSDEHATVFNATYDVTADGDIAINGSKNFAETLNLTIKGDAESKDSKIAADVFKDIKDVDIYNITADNVVEIALNVGGTGKPKELSISGKSSDKITVDGAATVKTGNGDDEITVTAAAGKKVVVNGGNGTDTVKLGAVAANDFTKLSLTNIEKLEGKGILSYGTLNQASFELQSGASTDLTVTAKSGIDLSGITAASAGSTIAIKDVQSGTVKLSDKSAGVVETITLKAGAAKVTVDNFVSTSDKLDIKAIGATAAAGADATLALKSLSFFEDSNGVLSFKDGELGADGVRSLTTLITNSAAFTAAGQKAYFAIADKVNDVTKLYEITNDASANITAGDEVKLIATINSVVVKADFTYVG